MILINVIDFLMFLCMSARNCENKNDSERNSIDLR